MAEGKLGANIGGNLGTGAGILAKRFQKSMNRAQEKVGVVIKFSTLSCVSDVFVSVVHIDA